MCVARTRYCWVLVALVALAAPARGGTTVEAIWHVQQLQFDYHSANVSYSCSALQERIRGILRAVGVHESILVEAGCAGDELVTSARTSISMAAPIEATDENVRIATTFAPHERLAARLHGSALPSVTDIERFPASWQRISLRPLRLTRGDCDLLDSLRREVFPRLRIRGATGFRCGLGPSRLAPVPRVEALVRTRTTRIRDLGVLLADSPDGRQ
jgi:hypothetical protein